MTFHSISDHSDNVPLATERSSWLIKPSFFSNAKNSAHMNSALIAYTVNSFLTVSN